MALADPLVAFEATSVERARPIAFGSKQLRFITPLPDRMGYAADWGDVLVTLTKSLNGRREEQSESARTLGLLHIGDQVLLRSSDRPRLRAAYSIQHLVAVTHFPGGVSPIPARRPSPGLLRVPGTHWYLAREDHARVTHVEAHEIRQVIGRARYRDSLPPSARTIGGGLVKSQKLRDDFDMDGGYYEFANEEYLHIEVDETGAVVLWSSDLNADAAVDVIEGLFGAPDPEDQGFVVSLNGDGAGEPSPDVIVTARTHPDDLRMFSVEYDDCIVSWRSAQVKMRAGKVPHVEITFSAHHVDSARQQQLMDRTATAHVKRALAEGGSDLIKSLVRPGGRSRRKSRS